jgi:predicted transcriptional regulator
MVSRKTMTIQIPDDLARGLEAIAAAQRKSVEQVALESLRSFFNKASSPEVILRAVRQMSHPSAAAVDDLDAAIAAGRLPVNGQGAFDRSPSQ